MIALRSMPCRVALAVFVLTAEAAFAGPPFQTDDPEPIEYRHYEAYLFTFVDHSGDGTLSEVPAFEFNYGAAPNLHLHVVVPGAYNSTQKAFGIGDIELGAKYRFVQEGKVRPQIGTFPMLELPTGDLRRGLGNGRLWERVPIWVQKGIGKWTTYGGVGYQVNPAAGAKDSLFAGWLVQKELNKRWTLGGEVYHSEAQRRDGQQTTFVDGGGYCNIKEGLSLLFMFGHTVTGERHTIGYLGLYYTWGPDRNAGKESGNAAGLMRMSTLGRPLRKAARPLW